MTFTPNELVWYNEGGDMQSGGYSVDSLFKTLGITPISNIDNTSTGNMTGGGSKKKQANMKQVKKVSELFGGGMAVPAGLSLLNQDISTLLSKQNNSQHGGDMQSGGDNGGYSTTLEGGGLIPESLFDKLTKLVTPDNDNIGNIGNTSNTGNNTKSRKKNKNTKKKTNNRSGSKNSKSKRKTKRKSNA